jgi:hypothetical protein
VSIARVRSPEEDDVRVFHLLIGARAATRTEDRRQTDDARCVSRSIAAIDVVVAERNPGQLPRQEIHLVRRLRAAEDSERVRPARREIPAKAFGRHIERFVPRGFAKGTVFANERVSQTRIRPGHGLVFRHIADLLVITEDRREPAAPAIGLARELLARTALAND